MCSLVDIKCSQKGSEKFRETEGDYKKMLNYLYDLTRNQNMRVIIRESGKLS